MDIKKIIKNASNPKPYDKGTAVMWTDKYISKQLLASHINSDIDIASRKAESIDLTTQWIIKQLGDKARVLDLGCGPGLYTQRIANAGHRVTGMDFSQSSIDYAKQQADSAGLDIDYVCGNYLETDFGSGYDLIMMIYCDFGVLSLEDRQRLLSKVYDALSPGGMFIFDTLNEKTIKNLTFQKSWEIAEHGFWKSTPYLHLSESFHFPENKATLDQHIVINEDGNNQIYRFWNHYFDSADIENIVLPFGFTDAKAEQILLEGGGAYNDDGVTFYTVRK